MAFKIKDVNLSNLENLDDAMLRQTLKDVSRIGNQRAKRMEKYDENYSGIYEYKRGKKFGAKETFKSREDMINEITRTVQTSSKLTKKRVDQENKMLKEIYEGGHLEGQGVTSEQLKKAWGWYKDGHGDVAIKIYKEVKNIMAQLPEEEYLTNAYNMLQRLVEEKEREEEERQKTIYDDDELPF